MFDKIVGQSKAKIHLEQLLAKAKVNELRKKHGLIDAATTLHSLFLGIPGSGKTTFARVMGLQLKESDLLSSGHFIE
ncbi:MAG: hypothetical protein KC478_10685, partial [Bacteriovoracaceae bacterium]|nr:hypothetical protein [Bacteriovoracaceae bacterium]